MWSWKGFFNHLCMLISDIRVLVCMAIVLGFTQVSAQAPEQDCVNSIAVCQNGYSQQNSYSGSGNLPNEIDPNLSCLGGGELNSVWYTMTIQSDGLLNFSITPNDPSDDYDWAVFNLTNATCADIFTNAALEVSCNFSGNTGNGGITGPNGITSGTGSSQNEDPIPVNAGETYMVNVSNFSSTQSGYSIDMAASTAAVYDDVEPRVAGIDSDMQCGDDELTFSFVENVLCSEVDISDFELVGPGGNYTINSLTGASCLAGNDYEKTYTITFSPAIPSGGTYYLILVGSIEDLCSNSAVVPDSFAFTIVAIDLDAEVLPDTCNLGVGEAEIITPQGTGPYNYQWNPNVSSTVSATGLSEGIYSVTVSDQNGGCPQEISVEVDNIPPPTADFTVKPQNISYIDPVAYFTDQSQGATNWQWNFGDGSPISDEQNPVHTFSEVQTYTVQLIASNDAGCSDTALSDVTVSFLTTVYIPNAFTPGYGNGINNEWGPKGEGITGEDYSLMVFDRWGKVIFETDDPTELWDGTDQDDFSEVPQGVYVYRLSLMDLNNENQTFVGSVTVLWK